ncbi:hypothetical protein [Pseudalkalibacillus decolorationis]|uniref:hypothetical protein n=1 Tax=Pseudalkalibacillus decolorationis TaxID=163879 RepID=UPI00214954CF|nr:hypothetical protein [Pseudalkalibacillus decolorationis]
MNSVGFLRSKWNILQLAAQKVFPNEILQPYPTIVECMEDAMHGKIDFAIVPLEN